MLAKMNMVTCGLLAVLVIGACVAPPAPAVAIPTVTTEAMTTETMTDSVMATEVMTDSTMMREGTVFRIHIENLSGDSLVPTPFSPGVWVLHSEKGPIFLTGEANRGLGLEAQSEDANPAQLDSALAATGLTHGIFNTAVGASKPGPATPGQSFSFDITATVDAPNVSFASMFGQSNDLFIGPDEHGIALFDANGQPIKGDVTGQIKLWDAGSELNEAPGKGPNQAPRQPAPNTGPADPDNTVRLVKDDYTYPSIPQLVRVTIELVDMTQ